jgi:hypothetical protein
MTNAVREGNGGRCFLMTSSFILHRTQMAHGRAAEHNREKLTHPAAKCFISQQNTQEEKLGGRNGEPDGRVRIWRYLHEVPRACDRSVLVAIRMSGAGAPFLDLRGVRAPVRHGSRVGPEGRSKTAHMEKRRSNQHSRLIGSSAETQLERNEFLVDWPFRSAC